MLPPLPRWKVHPTNGTNVYSPSYVHNPLHPTFPFYFSQTFPPHHPGHLTSLYFKATDLHSFQKPGSDETDSILTAAKKLATKLREKKAFTNTATFDLKCEQCGQGLKGEKG